MILGRCFYCQADNGVCLDVRQGNEKVDLHFYSVYLTALLKSFILSRTLDLLTAC